MALQNFNKIGSELTEKSTKIMRSCLIIFIVLLGRRISAKRVFFGFGKVLPCQFCIISHLV